jgi:aspartate-semialdehyde dehydrogenase
MSVFVELPAHADPTEVRKSLQGSGVHVTGPGEESPSNQSVTESADVHLTCTEDPTRGSAGRAYWLWMAADNLKLAARHAAACATELVALRPVKSIQ